MKQEKKPETSYDVWKKNLANIEKNGRALPGKPKNTKIIHEEYKRIDDSKKNNK